MSRFLITMQSELPSGGPDTVPASTPPGTVQLGDRIGVGVILSMTSGAAQAIPHFWDGLSQKWVPPGADIAIGLNQVSADTGSSPAVPVANGAFNQRSGGGAFWLVLKKGAGVVASCVIYEIETMSLPA